MPLAEVELSIDESQVPSEVVDFLREADARISVFFGNSAVRAGSFFPSDFLSVYHALRAICSANLAAGNSFCEWGSGFGVVASLAAMLEFDACGIEYEGCLVDASRRLAHDFDVPVEFVCGSFIPPGGEIYTDEACATAAGDFFWLVTESDDAYEELGRDPDDLDVVFAYPWPDEERVIEDLFDNYAAVGSLLLMHHEYQTVRLKRKVSTV